MAGMVKTALALKHRQIPPHLHFHNPNPDIPFDKLQLRVPTTLESWPTTDGPRYAGVNSFGFGGTNAHVVLQEAPVAATGIALEEEGIASGKKQSASRGGERPYLLPISARGAEALQALARSYRDFLVDSKHHLHDIGDSASQRRSHHDHRLAITAHSKAEAISQLEAYLAAQPRAGISSGRIPLNERPKPSSSVQGWDRSGGQWDVTF